MPENSDEYFSLGYGAAITSELPVREVLDRYRQRFEENGFTVYPIGHDYGELCEWRMFAVKGAFGYLMLEARWERDDFEVWHTRATIYCWRLSESNMDSDSYRVFAR